MNQLHILFISLLIVATMPIFGISEKERMFNELLGEHAKAIEKKYNLKASGLGGAIPDDIHSFIVDYDSNQLTTVPEARNLLVNVVEDLKTRVNENEKIRKHLSQFPFTNKNFRIMISFITPKNKPIDPPHVALVFVTNSKIHYNFFDKEAQLYDDTKMIIEPYEEALKIVQNEKGQAS